MPRRFSVSAPRFSLMVAFAAAISSAAPVTSAQPPASTALHVRIGPDGNACGITLPAAGPGSKSRHKPGLIVWLHGGMRSRNAEKGFEAHRALLPFVDPAAYYLCSPSASAGQEWTTPLGPAHIDALIDYMEAHYAFDTADINLVGVSDGSLGVIAYSLQGRRRVHRRVLISSAPQLVLPAEALPGRPRFADGSWDFLQGGRDRLFPADEVVPYLQRWQALYPNAHLHYFPDGEHDFSFYAEKASGLLTSLLAVQSQAAKPPSKRR